VADITNAKLAGASIRSSIQYYNAKNDHKHNHSIPLEMREDYVPNEKEVL